MMESKSPVCNTCGEEIGVKPNGEFFVACHECSFPICKACLEYEFKEGRRICLRCGNPYDGIITFIQMFFHKFLLLLFFVKRSFTVYDFFFVYSSENVLDDVETKTSKHQSTIATHISNTPQVCTIRLVAFFVFIKFSKRI